MNRKSTSILALGILATSWGLASIGVAACSSPDASDPSGTSQKGNGGMSGASTTGGEGENAGGGRSENEGGVAAGGRQNGDAGNAGNRPGSSGAGGGGKAEPGATGSGGISAGSGGRSKGAGGSTGNAGRTRTTGDAGTEKGTGGATKTTDGGALEGGGSKARDGGSSAGTRARGCGKEQPASPPKQVDSGGTARTFLVDLPENYDKDTPTPVLFALHGMGITASFFRTWSKLTPVFKSSYIVVYPDAIGDPTEWDSVGTKDFVFFDAMFDLLESTYCFDTDRVFVTGHSSGGYFTNALGCQRSKVVRGIAPQAGAGPIGSKSCGGPLPSLIIHGSKDTGVPPAEGVKSRDFWGKAAQCDMGSGKTSSLHPVCTEYGACQEGAPLVYCPYDGDHNLWKDAPQTMLDFFNRL